MHALFTEVTEVENHLSNLVLWKIKADEQSRMRNEAECICPFFATASACDCKVGGGEIAQTLFAVGQKEIL